ncbi:MAG: plasmid mobilization protein [Burkholderiales bacterium]
MARSRGTKTERLTVRVSAQEKRGIAARAEALHLSIAEMIRRSLNGGSMSEADEAALDALAEERDKNADETS